MFFKKNIGAFLFVIVSMFALATSFKFIAKPLAASVKENTKRFVM
jgi:hypothetical protein